MVKSEISKDSKVKYAKLDQKIFEKIGVEFHNLLDAVGRL